MKDKMMKEGESLINLATAFAINATDSRQSLSEFSAGSRLSPPVLMEDTIARMNPEITHSINQVLLGIYMGHYLAIVNRLAKVGNTSVSEMLDPLNGGGTLQSQARGAVGSRFGSTLSQASALRSSMESMDIMSTMDETNLDILGDFSQVSMEAAPDLSKPTNIAVGKIFDVPLISGDTTVTVPVTATILPRVLNRQHMLKVLEAFISKDNSYIGRFHRLMAGEFRSFAEYALGLDLIREDFNLQVADKDGQYSFAKLRQKRGLLSTFLTGKKSMNIASAMIVVSKNTANEIEGAIRGPLRSPRQRQKFFETTGSMILCIVDETRELVRIYQRGIEEYADYSYDELKPASTDPKALDVNAIMRAYNAGQQFSM